MRYDTSMVPFQIPLSEIEFSFVRSSGPGGQNVNKVNSKAVLRWNLVASTSVPAFLKARIYSRLAPRLTKSGELILTSDRTRDQQRNREDCLEKLAKLLAAAAEAPRVRKKTKPSRSSVTRAKNSKRMHSEKKKLRRDRGD